MSARTAVLLVGSAKPAGTSTSEALGRSLLRRLETAGVATRVFLASHCRDDRLQELVDAVAGAEIFVLATPMYVDALPYLVVRAFEAIAAARTRPGAPPPSPTRFLAIINCGFPETIQTQTAQDICRIFAAQARLELAGTLGLGGGETLRGQAPEQMGWLTRHVRRAFDLAAEALLAGRTVPEKAVELMARPIIPALGYVLVANYSWRKEARRWGAQGRLSARPYAPAPPAHAGD